MRKTTDCRGMTPEEKHAHQLAQKRASHQRRMTDPAYRAKRNAYERAKAGPRTTLDLSGWTPEQKQARKREQERDRRRARANDPVYRAKKRASDRKIVATKRAWQRAHADELNARRRVKRAANPQKYREQEKAAKQRRLMTKAQQNPK